MNNQVEEIKSKLDIIDVISEYVTLKQTGGGTYKGLCPFHNEKSPSFMASQNKQIFHCFGCGEGGDMFKFIMKIENVDFKEALKILAKKANVELKFDKEDLVKRSRKEILQEISNLAAQYYNYLLTGTDQGKKALEYLKNRGLEEETIKKFKLGYSLNIWNGLYDFLKSKKYSDEDIFLTGLIIKNNSGRYYDRFRGRIMYPIFNISGGVVAFTARQIETNKEEPKYINSPQTELYDKSSVIFGLNFAKESIRKNDCSIVVEGQMDCISCHQAGSENVVASSGTALTEIHIKTLKRFSNTICFCFDSDSAGENATERAIDIALENEINLKIISLDNTGYKDPDECIKNDLGKWTNAISEATPYLEFYFNKLHEQISKDLSVSNKPQEIKNIITPFLIKLSKINSQIEKNIWIKNLSKITDIDESTLKEELTIIYKKDKKTTFTPSKKIDIKKEESKIKEDDPIRKTEEFLVSAILVNQGMIGVLEKINLDIFEHEDIKSIATNMKACYNNKIDNILEYLFANDKKNSDYISYLTMLGEKFFSDQLFSLKDIKKDIKSNIIKLYRNLTNKELKQIKRGIEIAEKENNKEEIIKLQNLLIDKLNQLRKFSNDN
ncbi:MAG: DNA primase [Patescibacteria group bacterium]